MQSPQNQMPVPTMLLYTRLAKLGRDRANNHEAIQTLVKILSPQKELSFDLSFHVPEYIVLSGDQLDKIFGNDARNVSSPSSMNN